jgi:hypothetical protein
MAIAHPPLGTVSWESTTLATPLLPDDVREIIEPLLPKWTPSPKGGPPPLSDCQPLSASSWSSRPAWPGRTCRAR